MNDKEPIWPTEQQRGFREEKGSGAGAIRGGDSHVIEDVEHETRARTGPIPDEHMQEGWGGPGEPYPPAAQGPTRRGDAEEKQDRMFWGRTRPPAGQG
jgi:hypothetical protein